MPLQNNGEFMSYLDAQMEATPQRPLPDLRLTIGNSLKTKNVSHFANQNIQLPPHLMITQTGNLQGYQQPTV